MVDQDSVEWKSTSPTRATGKEESMETGQKGSSILSLVSELRSSLEELDGIVYNLVEGTSKDAEVQEIEPVLSDVFEEVLGNLIVMRRQIYKIQEYILSSITDNENNDKGR